MKPFDGKELGELISAHVRAYLAKATGKLAERLDALERKLLDIPAGPQGERGEKGDSIQGDPGPAGKDGTCILSGEGPPEEVMGKSGDHYIDVLTGDLYRCD